MNDNNLDLLRTFELVAREGKFKTAAQKLSISSAAVTKKIQKLETQLGRQLFYRTTARTELTQEGKTLLQRALKLLNDHDTLVQDTTAEGVEKTLRIGCPESWCNLVTDAFLTPFQRDFAQFSIELNVAPVFELQRMLKNRQLHFALFLPARGGEHEQLIGISRPVWVTSSSTAELAFPLPLAINSAMPDSSAKMLAALQQRGIDSRTVLTSPSWSTIEHYIRGKAVFAVTDLSCVTPALTVVENLPAMAGEALVVQAADTLRDTPTMSAIFDTLCKLAQQSLLPVQPQPEAVPVVA